MSSMILRSFHIPVEMDYELERVARERNLAKSLLVRHFVHHGLNSPDVLDMLPKSEREQSNREVDQVARRGREMKSRTRVG